MLKISRLLICLFLLLPASTEAATFVVTKTTDDNGPCTVDDCALREAVIAANALPGQDHIVLGPGRYVFSIDGPDENDGFAGDLNIREGVIIEGASASSTIIDAAGIHRIFDIFVPVTQVVIRRITITGGVEGAGGGFYILEANVLIQDCEISGNRADDAGGIQILLSTVRIERTMIADNVAEVRGGGLEIWGVAPHFLTRVAIVNSTITGNSAGQGGGALISDDSYVELINSTVTNNTASLGSAFDRESAAIGSLQFTNSIIDGDCTSFASGGTLSFGGNVSRPNNYCGLNHPTDQPDVIDLRLGPLALNGGQTQTFSLFPDSPAIDAAGETCDATDQRGEERPYDGDGDGVARCDSGAYELGFHGAVTEIPTLDAWALGILALALTFAAGLRIRSCRSAPSATFSRSPPWIRGPASALPPAPSYLKSAPFSKVRMDRSHF